MRVIKKCSILVFSFFITVLLLPSVGSAEVKEFPDPYSYIPSSTEIYKIKKRYDDPTPTRDAWKKMIPKVIWDHLTRYDIPTMKKTWAECVGFKAPDVVGKIAPEIKPGKYTYKDLDKYPGLKELMWPHMYDRIKPGGPPHAGNIPEFEIVPTRQYYWAYPIAEATKKYEGKTKQDKDGYWIPSSYEAGYAFPKPSGPERIKAMQIMYNIEQRYLAFGANRGETSIVPSFDKKLKTDNESDHLGRMMRLKGRVLFPPYGCYDKRAKENEEYQALFVSWYTPRDLAGMGQTVTFYMDPNKRELMFLYIPFMRRVRKLSATDTQDAVPATDQIYDDMEGWKRKHSPIYYPYDYKILAEREYLFPAPSWDGSEYVASEGKALMGLKFERRPFYVVEMTCKDPNYVYSKSILYVDKETFNFHFIENYDQKGRLYRSWFSNLGFEREMGIFSWHQGFVIMRDHVDTHSGFFHDWDFPCVWTREDMGIRAMMEKGK